MRVQKLLERLVATLVIGGVLAGCSATDRPATPAGEPFSPSAAAEVPPADLGWPRLDRFQTLRFDRYSLEEGLSQSSALCLLQDQQGFIWIGTEDGLNRFDGAEFTIYRVDSEDPNSISNNHVRALAEDPSGDLWIGTYGGGLNRLELATGDFRHYRHDPQDASSLASDQILALFVDSKGSLWVGTRGGGLSLFDSAKDSFIHFKHDSEDSRTLSHDVVRAIAEDEQGRLWIGTNFGLNRFNRVLERFTRYNRDPGDPGSLGADPILDLFVDSAGTLWIGTSGGGLDRYFPETDDFAHYPYNVNDPFSLSHPSVNAILEDPAGGLWVGTEIGLNYLDQSTERFIGYHHDPADPASLSRSEVDSLLLDTSGGLWAGTYGGGLSRVDPQQIRFALYQMGTSERDGLSESSVWGLLEDSQGILWVGTDGAGLDSFDRKRGMWSHYRFDPENPTSLGSDVVMDVFEDHLGAMWVSTVGGGLNQLDRGTGRFKRYSFDPEDPQSLSSTVAWFAREDREGNLWVGTAVGLNRFDRKTEQFTRYMADPQDPTKLADNNVGSFFEDSTGTIWVGTHSGLHQFDASTERFTRFQHDPQDPLSLSHDIVFSIYEDQSGTLWLGTWGGGLNRFVRDSSTFEHYRIADGLPNEVIYGIMEDAAGNLWLTTNYGLSRFDPKTELFTNFTVADGLQSNEFSYNGYAVGASGLMYVGGIGGVNIFEPERIAANPFVPPIVITSLSSAGEPLEAAPEIVLKWPDNNLEFEYAALSYSQPELNQYAYRLDGFDDSWISTLGRRFGRYTNLPVGDYTLQVIGSNQDGVWNAVGAAVEISVEPAFWATWWFRALALVLVGWAGYGAYRLQISRVEARSLELEKQVTERTHALEARTRDLDQRRKELEALYRADEELLGRLDLDAVLQALVDTAIEILEADKGGVLVWDFRKEELVVRAARGFSPASLETMTFAPGQGVVGEVFESGKAIAVEDARLDPRVTRALVEAESIEAFIQVPIKIGNEVYGVFSADYLQPRPFDEATIRMLSSLASHAALAIDNARLYQEQKRRAEQFKVLNAVGRHVTSIMAIDELLCELVDLIRETFDYYLVEIGLIEGDELVFRAGSGASWAEGFESFRLKVGEQGLTGMVAASGESAIIRDVREDDRYVRVSATETLSELAVPIKARDRVIGVINIESDDCCTFDESDLVVFQSLADQAAIAIENAQLYERTASQVAKLSALQQTTKALASTLELEGLLSLIIQQATSLVQADGGLINLVAENGAEDETVAATGLAASTVGLSSPLDGSLSGWVTLHNQPVVVNDLEHDQRVHRASNDLVETKNLKSAAVAPLAIKDEVIGTLVVVGTESGKGDFNQADLDVLVSFANQAAVAIENARLYSQAGHLAAVEERGRLARELHDAVTQTLFSASLIAEALPAVWQEDREEGNQLLHELRQLNRGALAEMRSLLMELRPAALEEAKLSDLMRQLGAAITGRSGMQVEVHTDADCVLPADVHVTIYRIAQEALNNITKHAHATEVRLDLTWRPSSNGGAPGSGQLELRVRDNGRGFDQQGVSSENFGLKIIRERAEDVGAHLRIDSQPGEGTTVLVSWEG
jgi:ligand-binding sensor domain-containing protein/signal transduction histidine kinase